MHNSSWVTLCISPLEACWDVSLGTSLKQRRVMQVSPEETRHCNAWKLPHRRLLRFVQELQGSYAQTQVKDDTTVNGVATTGDGRPILAGVWKSLLLARKTHQNLGHLCAQLQQDLPTSSHSNLQEPLLSQSV